MYDLNDSRDEALKEVVVLYVEDEDDVRELASKYLSRFIPNLLVADSGEEALRISENKNIDVLVTDINMKTVDGAELAIRIKERNPSCYIIFSTAYSDTERLMQAVDIKVDKYMVKPVDWKELVNAVSQYAQRVFMVNHIEDDSYTCDCGFVSADVYKVLSETISCIEEGITLISEVKPDENTIKSVHSLETARKYIEKILKDYF